jgi:hypothetical protein
MTAQRIDRILLGLGAFLILISSYQLFFTATDFSSGPKLGTLTSTLSVVKTKNALALDWRDAASGNDLTENQLIYTDKNSSAEVVFTEGSVIEIGENSLVKLKTTGLEHGMDLSKGFIRAKLQSDRPLKVLMNGEDFLVTGKNAEVQINIQDNKGEIGVLNGEIQVESAGLVENLTPASALEINGNQMVKKAIYFKTLAPAKGEIFYTAAEFKRTNFMWTPQEEARVIVSHTPSMKKTVSHASTADLKPGLYYYKIESDEGSSLINSFRIIQEVSPIILRPLDGETINILQVNSPKVLLQWESQERLKYLVEWNDGDSHSKIVQGGSTLIGVKDSVPFKWRVKIQDDQRPEAQWGQWQEVRVHIIPMPVIPTNLHPDGVDFQTYQTPIEKIELSWEAVDTVELQVKNPKGDIWEKRVKEKALDYHPSMAGNFSWRVRGVDSYLRTSEWSDWQSFSIEDLSQEKSPEGIQRIQLKRPDQSVSFSWSTQGGGSSVFELSKDRDFKTIIRKIEVNKDSAQVNIPEVGAYYWRSRQYLSDGTLHVSEPKRVIIEPVPAPDRPERLPDLEVPLVEQPFQTSGLQKVMNFILSSAYANEVKGVVRIELPVKDEAKGFIVRIFRDEALTELVYQEEIKSKIFEWKNAEAGEFYWQYAVIDFWDRKSQFSDPSRLTIRSELIPLPLQPRLLAPIRADEVEQKNLTFKWRTSPQNVEYKVEISRDRDFKNILHTKRSKVGRADFSDLTLTHGLHFWRVYAFNRRNQEVLSNTGRFTIVPPMKKIVIADFPKSWNKVWSPRGFVAWAPSLDNYSFSDGEAGKINGTTMMSGLISGSIFKEHYAVNGEILRQSGEVFEGESYLFQRLLIDGVKTWNRNSNHKLAAGLAIGQSSGQAYSISDSKVSSTSVSGLSYGPILRNFLAFNKTWEMQGRALYLLGEIKQLEIGADAIYHYQNYLLMSGLSYASRDYELSSGQQTSIKLSLGIGKEF